MLKILGLILSDSLQLVSFDFELLALKICSFELFELKLK